MIARIPRRAGSALMLAIAVTLAATALRAQEERKILPLIADAELIESGLIAWLTPRFRFKTRLSIEAGEDGAAQLAILPETAAAERHAQRPRTPVIGRDGRVFVAVVLVDDAEESRNAKRLVSWLVSDAGKRAIAGFAPEAGAPFTEPGALAPQGETEAVEGDAAAGERLALIHCGRCHVVGDKNRYGGIGSTPSFPALRSLADHREKFAAFWTLNPHPSFMQVAGITEPFDPLKPPHIAPIELTLEEVEAIAAFVETITPKDLGQGVQPR